MKNTKEVKIGDTVVRLATEQDVTLERGSTPHTTAKVLDNLNSAKPRLRQNLRLDGLLANKKAHQCRPSIETRMIAFYVERNDEVSERRQNRRERTI